MKKISHLFIFVLITFIFLVSFATGTFADRTLIIENLPKIPYRNGVGAFEGVVAHSTATPEAPAINIQKYETRTWHSAFVHYAVDWNETIQIADTNYIAYGAGPDANSRFVHVELCETADDDKFKRSYNKYVKLLAMILRNQGLSVEKGLWTHDDVRRHLGGTTHEDPLAYLKSRGVSESQFRSDIKYAYNHSNDEFNPTESLKLNVPSINKVVYIEGFNINLRKGPGTSYSVIRQVNKTESYAVLGEQDGWLNLGGNQWIKYDPSYIRLNTKENMSSSIVGHRIVSKVDNLRFYGSPSWEDKDVAGVVNIGEGFIIDTEIIVNDSKQYKVHNSKNMTFYITASSSYIEVK
ncbi:N-acetylmuramoyl-L-alanine amidase [Bacillus pseudomycoides]|uniref:N-acetylmuramoyl-L-alanine amidase n=1 Tax=Bacillus pseudomycoides TaxID=64104 RepID=UPI000BF34022|nr:N-acetylmuramoyl-L-alanine amidase [Bacillus pseudomycoides]MED4653057.1 N-acetylmuramoyl-L-alanine amidase [Bacillus pseudomycoides]PGC23538.1 N-acetylmuramoyl-L-alanine amidase [Bacillus pseudomycoides]